MSRLLVMIGVLLGLAQACRADLVLTGGPVRSFGGRTITRTFRLDTKGPADIEWRTRIIRGIIERGTMEAVEPGDVKIDLKLPAVRARIEMVHEVQVKQDGKVVASGEFPIDLFPVGLLAPSETPAPEIGVIDEGGTLASFLEKAGWRVVRLATNLQFTDVESKVVVVGASQAESEAEPMSGLKDFAGKGGTVIFLEQSEGRKNLFDDDRRWDVVARDVPTAEPVVKAAHPALLDLRPGDLSNWVGSGTVAAHVLSRDDWPWQRAWLYSPVPDAAPLVVEYWNGKGRVILCQCDVAKDLESEPVAQLLLRNILHFAMTQPASPAPRIVRMAWQRNEVDKDGLPEVVLDPKVEEMKDALASITVLVPNGQPDPADRSLVELLGAGCPAVIQSGFDRDMIAALNRLMAKLQLPTDRQPAPEFAAQERTEGTTVELDYAHRLLWGLPAEPFSKALAAVQDVRIPAPAVETPGFEALTQPGILSQFKRGDLRVVLCALPIDDPKNEFRRWIVDQVLANLADQPVEEKAANVQ